MLCGLHVFAKFCGFCFDYVLKFMGELARVAAPGGRIILVTWCHRDLEPGEKSLKPAEQVRNLIFVVGKAKTILMHWKNSIGIWPFESL